MIYLDTSFLTPLFRAEQAQAQGKARREGGRYCWRLMPGSRWGDRIEL